MIRVMYRWTVKPEDREQFVRTWGEGTVKIQTSCTGAMGSILLCSSEHPEHFYGMARWPSREAWQAGQEVMPFLGLQGPPPDSECFFEELIDIIPEFIE
jgi:heme-degrading monooxygenase HmoA